MLPGDNEWEKLNRCWTANSLPLIMLLYVLNKTVTAVMNSQYVKYSSQHEAVMKTKHAGFLESLTRILEMGTFKIS